MIYIYDSPDLQEKLIDSGTIDLLIDDILSPVAEIKENFNLI